MTTKLPAMDNPRVVEQIVNSTWRVTMEWAEGTSYGGPARMVIESIDRDSPPLSGLSSTVLRDVDFRAAVAEFRNNNSLGYSPQLDLNHIRTLSASGVSDLYLAKLSEAYLEYAKSRPKPVQALANDLGKPQATVQGHLWQAGNRGILDRKPGLLGGELTDKAKELLK